MSISKPRVEIHYCTGCNWLLRAGWLAQELLSSLSDVLGGVALIPDASGGVFEIRIDDQCIWERVRDGGFPDSAELKRRVRDVLAPDRDMGHLDKN